MAGAAPALAQNHNLPEFHSRPTSAPPKTDQEIIAETRRAAGLQDLQPFGPPQQQEKPFPFLFMGLALLAGVVAMPFAYRMYKSTRAELDDQRTFGRNKGAAEEAPASPGEQAGVAPRISRRPASRDSGETRISSASAAAKALAPPEATPRDAVWDAVSGAGRWVTVEWVASEVGLSKAVVADEMGALATEGYFKQARDSAGNLVFRVNG